MVFVKDKPLELTILIEVLGFPSESQSILLRLKQSLLGWRNAYFVTVQLSVVNSLDIPAGSQLWPGFKREYSGKALRRFQLFKGCGCPSKYHQGWCSLQPWGRRPVYLQRPWLAQRLIIVCPLSRLILTPVSRKFSISPEWLGVHHVSCLLIPSN